MNAERVGSLFWLAIGLMSFYGSFLLGLGALHEPGPGFLPFLASCFVCLMAIIVFLQSLVQKKEAAVNLSALWAGVDWHSTLIITLLLVGFIVVLEWLGFIPSSFFLLFILFRWEGKMSWTKAIAIPVVTLSITYLLFVVFLKSTIPKGILGF